MGAPELTCTVSSTPPMPNAMRGGAACLSLDGDDAEIPFGREHECARLLHLLHDRKWLVTEDLDVGAGFLFPHGHVLTVADYHKALVRHAGERLDYGMFSCSTASGISGRYERYDLEARGSCWMNVVRSLREHRRAPGMVLHLSCRNRDVQVVPALRSLPLYGIKVNNFFAHEVLLLTMRNNLARRRPQLIKRCFDLVVAALVLGSPLFLFIGLQVARTDSSFILSTSRCCNIRPNTVN
jgi:hypothetical protein